MARHHLIISGTGRAGTTLLIQLLTKLGLDTGFTDTTSEVHLHCDAGMEKDIRDENAPYVVKSPFLCEHLDDVLQGTDVVVDHAIIPVRHLFAAAESRRSVARRNPDKKKMAGGLFRTKNPVGQEIALAQLQYHLVYTLAKHDIPVTLLYFPRLATEPEYLYRKISPTLSSLNLGPNAGYGAFLKAFESVSRPSLIHDFTTNQEKNGGYERSFLRRLCGVFKPQQRLGWPRNQTHL